MKFEKGMKWFHNGNQKVCCFPEDCPEGFTPGQKDERKVYYVRKTDRPYTISDQSPIDGEEWRECTINKGYQVSNMGRIKGKNGNILHPTPNKLGYCIVNLDRKSYSVHRLVGLAFIPNPNNYRELDHINRDKTDNRVENLRWVTRSENSKNRDLEGWYLTHPKGIGVGSHKTARPVMCIETGKVFSSVYQAHCDTGIPCKGIRECCNGILKTTYKLHWKWN